MNKILKITNSYPHLKNQYAGVFVKKQADSLEKIGYDVTVINPMPKKIGVFFKDYNEKDNKEINVIRPRFRQLPSNLGFLISLPFFYYSVKKSLKKNQSYTPDLIHAHWGTPSGITAVMIGKKYKVPVVITLRGSDVNKYPKKNFIVKMITFHALRNADKILTVSEKLKNDIILEYKIDQEKIETVYNGVNLTKFNKNTSKVLSEEHPYLLFVGSLKKEKGIFELIAAFEKIKEFHPNYKLKIIGTGKEKRNIEKYISLNNLESEIILLGSIQNDNLKEWYSNSEFVVLPSYSEGLPNVLVEAIACGKKVIGTDVGGIPEIINLGVGYTIPPQNIELLYQAILKMISDNKKSYDQQKIRSIAERNFDEKVASEKIRNIYDELLKYRGKKKQGEIKYEI